MRTIETARLILEPQQARHAPEMYAVLSDPAIYDFENAPPPDPAWLTCRFERLETRLSPDGSEQWLNWVVRLRDGWRLIGYVQATVRPDAGARIAYELDSACWSRGFGREAVGAMIRELGAAHRVAVASAVFKRDNFRSRRLLLRLGFAPVPAPERAGALEPDEDMMVLTIRAP